MDEAQQILKELRVDWEDVMGDSFNPLLVCLRMKTNARLATEFREMYHRLEHAMESIVEANYTGFRDSVLCFGEFYKGNRRAMDALGELSSSAREIGVDSLALDGISADQAKRDLSQLKYAICRDLRVVSQAVAGADGDLPHRCRAIVRALDLVDNREYTRIRGVNEYRKAIYGKYKELVAETNERVFDYVFGGISACLASFGCVITLGSLYELENAFEKGFHRAMEGEIARVRAMSTDLAGLCAGVAAKLASIKRNMLEIIARVEKHFQAESNEDFFGQSEKALRFCRDGAFVGEEIEKGLASFVRQHYRGTTRRDASVFELAYVADDIDYSKLYGEQFRISARLRRQCQATTALKGQGANQPVAITPSPAVVRMLIQSTGDYSMKAFLRQLEAALYEKDDLERDKGMIDALMAGDPLRVDQTSKTLAFLAPALAVIEDRHGELLRHLKEHFIHHFCALLHGAYPRIFHSRLVRECINQDSPESGAKLNSRIQKILTGKYIGKRDLFLSVEKYNLVMAILNSLVHVDSLFSSDVLSHVHRLYAGAFRCQLNLEFFYFFDLLFRQGNHRFYMRSIMRVLQMVCSEAGASAYYDCLYENIEVYARENIHALGVRTRGELAEFIANIRILDEVMGEVDFFNSMEGLYSFLESIMNGACEDSRGKEFATRLMAN